MTASLDMTALKSDLMRDEGEVLHAYQDSRGYWTIGVGILIDVRDNGGITHEESQFLLENRIQRKLQKLAAAWPRFKTLDGTRQRALANMAYQLGVDGVLEFRHMLHALVVNDWKSAHDAALNSDWARETPHRADRIATMLLRGDT